MLDKWLITIPQLTGDEERYAYVYVPDGYEEGTQFPVLYMFDGHNLWDDDEASFGKSWGMLDYLEETNAGSGLKISRAFKPFFQIALPVLILIVLIQGLI